ncbi:MULTISPECIES: enterochelin esterase [unclassified Duganella]|uniref:enterochelin esterase n=1 Tax=unclassified Duganella TaxID=2636909 RepID=UPI000890F991|nr:MULTISPECIES: enterochelin esterase [unclassified Duganella]SDF64251.1 enterochelin esterase [Duganella sp. OV458]SDI64295.1 enterochelin esterase [Duganella sp. OV510]
MMGGLRKLIVAALCWLGVVAQAQVFSGALEAQTHREHPVRLAEGDFVQGRLAGKAMRLVLLDRDGKRAQILAKGRRDVQEFMFVAGDRGPYVLDVRAPEAGSYELSVLQQVPLAAQVAPAPVIESPRLRALQQSLEQSVAAANLAASAGRAAVTSVGDPAATGSTASTFGSGVAVLDAFWREVAAQGGPLVERVAGLPKDQLLLTFLWRGATRNVRILGAPSADHDEMSRLGNSDVWYRSYRVPASTRLSYRLAPDVPELNAPASQRRRAILATVQRDPLNPRSFPEKTLDKYDGASVLELPAAPSQDWVQPREGVPAGQLERLRLASKALGNERDIYLYRSHGYRPGAKGNALVVLFDAENYTTDVPTPAILDKLVAAGKLPPTAAILIANPSAETRGAELPPNPAFARFLAEELMPWAKARGVHAGAANTVVAGASYGGLASAWAGLKHPEWFGNVYSQSGSFWWAPPEQEAEWLTREYAAAPPRKVRFLLEAGLFEVGRNGSFGILETSRHLRDVLRAKGYQVEQREFAAGHDYYHWRGSLGEGLIRLIGKAP